MLSPQIETLGNRVIGCAMRVHSELGPGLLESTYERCMMHELELSGIAAVSQKLVSIHYKGEFIPKAYYMDILVEDVIVLELKSVEFIAPEHKSQLLTYMRLGNKQLGFLINFGATSLRSGLHRVIWTKGTNPPQPSFPSHLHPFV
jgi:GxxExxY protein